MLRREPWRALFPLGMVLAWLGVVPWLLFALRLPGAVKPFYGALAYRSFFHPVAELEGFVGCFAAGLLFTLLPRETGAAPPSAWQVGSAFLAPLASAVLGAIGYWPQGQAAMALLLLAALAFLLERLPRPLPTGAIWLLFGFALCIAGAALGEAALRHGDEWFWLHEDARDLVMQGLFSCLAIGAGRMLRGDEPPPRLQTRLLHAAAGLAFAASFFIGARHLGFALRALITALLARPLRPRWEFGPENLRRGLAHLALWLLAFGNAWAAVAPIVRRAGLHVIFIGCFGTLLLAALSKARQGGRTMAAAAGLFALATLARAMVEVDPRSFHLWMGLAAASYLCATVACATLSWKLA
jgi:hypothetical protein